jgi:hypothetical protein
MYWDLDRPPPRDRITDFFLGLDLAQANDFTALAVVERTTFPRQGYVTHYSCRHLRRWSLGTSYPEIVRDLGSLVGTISPRGLRLLGDACLVVDITGVGRPVVDMFERIPYSDEQFVRVLITNGQGATFDRPSGSWHVARRELVGVMQALLQTSRLKVAQSLPEAKLLTEELLAFKAKVAPLGNDPLEWRERDHDDLVLALAVALWFAERFPPEPPCDLPVLSGGKQSW